MKELLTIVIKNLVDTPDEVLITEKENEKSIERLLSIKFIKIIAKNLENNKPKIIPITREISPIIRFSKNIIFPIVFLCIPTIEYRPISFFLPLIKKALE